MGVHLGLGLGLVFLVNLGLGLGPEFDFIQRSSLTVNGLHTPAYIYIRQLSSFKVPTLWFIDLAVATNAIFNTFF